MSLGQMVEFGHHLGMATAAEIGLDALLEGGHPRFFQSRRLGPSHRNVGHVGQGRASPERQRLAQPRRGPFVVASGGVLASLGQQVLESGSVESSTLDLQEVAGRLGDHDGVAAAFSERLAQPGDEDAERAGGPFLGFSAPEVLHQALGWNDPVGG
jgi:hypothetical protein